MDQDAEQTQKLRTRAALYHVGMSSVMLSTLHLGPTCHPSSWQVQPILPPRPVQSLREVQYLAVHYMYLVLAVEGNNCPIRGRPNTSSERLHIFQRLCACPGAASTPSKTPYRRPVQPAEEWCNFTVAWGCTSHASSVHEMAGRLGKASGHIQADGMAMRVSKQHYQGGAGDGPAVD